MNEQRPLLLLTLGDVAGIGPEVVVKAWPDPALHALCRPVVVGDVGALESIIRRYGLVTQVSQLADVASAQPSPTIIPCLQGTPVDLRNVRLGEVDRAAGQAAYDFLVRAIDLTLAGQAAGIVTLPLHKEGLHLAGVPHPGHTEILAERCGSSRFAMMLYFDGLGVTHVTLHVAIRRALELITQAAIVEKVELTHVGMTRLLGRAPRLGVAGLNPHASDGGLFGDEEERIIRPAVLEARRLGLDVTGPWPSDTLFVRARAGEFDGLIVQYHDQGHVAIKLLAGYRAVNVSLGLPIVRTSVAHGTAYDVVGQGKADPVGLIEAVRVAARLASRA